MKEKRAPTCANSLSAAMRPPCASMTERQIASPKPELGFKTDFVPIVRAACCGSRELDFDDPKCFECCKFSGICHAIRVGILSRPM